MKYIALLVVFNDPILEQKYMDIINNFIDKDEQILEVYKLANRIPNDDERRCETLRRNNRKVVTKALKHAMDEESEVLIVS